MGLVWGLVSPMQVWSVCWLNFTNLWSCIVYPIQTRHTTNLPFALTPPPHTPIFQGTNAHAIVGEARPLEHTSLHATVLAWTAAGMQPDIPAGMRVAPSPHQRPSCRFHLRRSAPEAALDPHAGGPIGALVLDWAARAAALGLHPLAQAGQELWPLLTRVVAREPGQRNRGQTAGIVLDWTLDLQLDSGAIKAWQGARVDVESVVMLEGEACQRAWRVDGLASLTQTPGDQRPRVTQALLPHPWTPSPSSVVHIAAVAPQQVTSGDRFSQLRASLQSLLALTRAAQPGVERPETMSMDCLLLPDVDRLDSLDAAWLSRAFNADAGKHLGRGAGARIQGLAFGPGLVPVWSTASRLGEHLKHELPSQATALDAQESLPQYSPVWHVLETDERRPADAGTCSSGAVRRGTLVTFVPSQNLQDARPLCQVVVKDSMRATIDGRLLHATPPLYRGTQLVLELLQAALLGGGRGAALSLHVRTVRPGDAGTSETAAARAASAGLGAALACFGAELPGKLRCDVLDARDPPKHAKNACATNNGPHLAAPAMLYHGSATASVQSLAAEPEPSGACPSQHARWLVAGGAGALGTLCLRMLSLQGSGALLVPARDGRFHASGAETVSRGALCETGVQLTIVMCDASLASVLVLEKF